MLKISRMLRKTKWHSIVGCPHTFGSTVYKLCKVYMWIIRKVCVASLTCFKVSGGHLSIIWTICLKVGRELGSRFQHICMILYLEENSRIFYYELRVNQSVILNINDLIIITFLEKQNQAATSDNHLLSSHRTGHPPSHLGKDFYL